ncbi:MULTISPECIES: hypothetical protein [unclassified Streptomyces]|uniref:hypothetical protein n=1 Tax=unclassified Streptomyces TaxID=2593676 RepID=UPI0033A4401F
MVGSATAAGGERLNGFKNGANAKGDVKLGAVNTDHDSRVTSEIIVTNGSASPKSYAVQVNFRDATGDLLDSVVVTIDGVGSKSSQDATARSNRKLSGDVKADVGTVLRH